MEVVEEKWWKKATELDDAGIVIVIGVNGAPHASTTSFMYLTICSFKQN